MTSLVPPARIKPLFDVGQRFRLAREHAGLKQGELAKKAKMRHAQLSRLENGYNIESRFYHRVAVVLGFRTALELIETTDDPQTRKLLRLWRAMEPTQREAAYRKLRVWLLED